MCLKIKVSFRSNMKSQVFGNALKTELLLVFEYDQNAKDFFQRNCKTRR